MSVDCFLVLLVAFLIALAMGVYVGTDRPHEPKG